MTHMMPKVRCSPTFWAARYNTWLLITLTPKGVVFAFLNMIHIYSSGQNEHATVSVQELHAFIAADVRLSASCQQGLQLLTWVIQSHIRSNKSMQLLNVKSGMPMGHSTPPLRHGTSDCGCVYMQHECLLSNMSTIQASTKIV